MAPQTNPQSASRSCIFRLQLLLCWLCLLCAYDCAAGTSYIRGCYYASWAGKRFADARFWPENIDPSLCTHIYFAFTNVTNNKLLPFGKDDDGPHGLYSRLARMRQLNPSVKIMLSIGGGRTDQHFSEAVASKASMAEFITNVINYARERDFDGIDIDWEYPTFDGGVSEDKHRYTELVKAMRPEIDKRRMLLTSAIPSHKFTAETAYELKPLSTYLDFINVMAYDFSGPKAKVTKHQSALFPEADSDIRYYLAKGVPSRKIVLGLPLYGRAYTLADPTQHGIGAPVTGISTLARSDGSVGYREICQLINKGSLQEEWIDAIKEPIAYKGDQWVCYENAKSFKEKADYIKKHNLGGAMVWEISYDDFRGQCGPKYPLLNVLKTELPA